MLVLTRLAGESLDIGEDIQVRVLGITNKRVRLGIIAGPNRVILRSELRNRERSPASPPRR